MVILPLVSVIIPTISEERNIGNCLESIYKQTYKKFEVIVVDNNSTDLTRLIAQKYTTQVFNLPEYRDLHNIKNFKGAQLNLGFKKSKGKIIFFPDADMTFDKDLLKEIVELITTRSYDALYVPEKIIGTGFLGEIRNFERSFYNQTCIDAFRVVKRDIFKKIGGCDEKNVVFGPDDWDLTKIIKKVTNKFNITRNYSYHHEENITLKLYLNKKAKYAKVFGDYINKWGKNDIDIKKQLGFYYRFFGVFIEDGKWRKLVREPKFTLGMYFLRFLVGWQYFKKLLFH